MIWLVYTALALPIDSVNLNRYTMGGYNDIIQLIATHNVKEWMYIIISFGLVMSLLLFQPIVSIYKNATIINKIFNK